MVFPGKVEYLMTNEENNRNNNNNKNNFLGERAVSFLDELPKMKEIGLFPPNSGIFLFIYDNNFLNHRKK